MGKNNFQKVLYTTEIIARCTWLLVGLVRSLKFSHKEALNETLLCGIYSDLTSITSNKIPDIHIAVSVVYGTFKKYFLHACSYCLILHFNCEMKLSFLLMHTIQAE